MNQAEAIEAAKELPWAEFVAMDDDGQWSAFEKEPYRMEGRWFRPQVMGWGSPMGKIQPIGRQAVPENLAIRVRP